MSTTAHNSSCVDELLQDNGADYLTWEIVHESFAILHGGWGSVIAPGSIVLSS